MNDKVTGKFDGTTKAGKQVSWMICKDEALFSNQPKEASMNCKVVSLRKDDRLTNSSLPEMFDKELSAVQHVRSDSGCKR